MRLRDLNELSNGRYTVYKDVNDVWPSGSDVLVRRHGDRDLLVPLTRLEALGIEEEHAVAHVHAVRNKSTVVQRDLDVLSVGNVVERDDEGRPIGLQRLGVDLDTGRASGVALEVRRGVDLVTELGDEGVLVAGLKDGLLHGVGARDEERCVEQQKGDTVLEAREI